MSIEKLEASSSLGVYDAQWEANLELYKVFKAEFGREPSVGEVYRGKNLGIWCKAQRDFYHKRTLSAERWQKLTDARFAFRLYEKAWQDSFRTYVAFKAEHGREPSSSGGPVEEKLARWCMVQRRAYKSSALLAEREQLLLDAGFVFKPRNARWQAHFEVYVAFKKEFGREPKVNDVYQGLKIGSWCKTQRGMYRSDRLPADRAQKLLDAGFDFARKRSFSGPLEDKILYATRESTLRGRKLESKSCFELDK